MPLPLAIMLLPGLLWQLKYCYRIRANINYPKVWYMLPWPGVCWPRVSAAGCGDQLVKAAARGWRLSGAAAGAVWRHQASGRRIWVRHNTLELQTNLREIFTITEKARDLKVLIFP